MSVLCLPSVNYPENIVTNKEMVTFVDKYHKSVSHKKTAIRMINNTTIEKRHVILPFEELIKLDTFGIRSELYERYAKSLSLTSAKKALLNSKLKKENITMVIVTSCTGFMMPSLTVHLINELGLNADTIQMPIAQMGCVGGAYAINRATEHCALSPNNNVLIVALETSSLCFHKNASRLQDFVSDSIFGDGAASVVMRADEAYSGIKITATKTFIINDTEEYIKYSMTDNGFKFSLDKDVMYSVKKVAPIMKEFIISKLGAVDKIDFFVSHTGGKRILDEVEEHLFLKPGTLFHSRESLRLFGNTSSVSVIDVLARHFEGRKKGDKGVISAFGPGFTTEMAVGEWVGSA